MSFQPGDVIADKYRIVGMIGRGGVGEVYEGENIRIRRKVAIKTLRAEFVEKTEIVQRFEREAQAAGRIGSKHIVEVLDLGDLPDGSRFLVMEFLEGTTLSKQIKTLGRMTAIDTAQLLLQLLEGLGGAHAAGIIHRDLKPANIFILRKAGEPFVKILDFGVSKFNTLASDELAMTKTGVVVGTPYYMAPEQAKGARAVDGRADLYAVGVIAYECVTGQVPFSAQTFNELLFKIVLEAPPPLEKFAPDLDPHFASLVRKAMAREPNMRFQTAAELQGALSDWLVSMTGGRLGSTLANTTAFSRESSAATAILAPGQAATAQVAAAVAAAQAAQPPGGPAAAGGSAAGVPGGPHHGAATVALPAMPPPLPAPGSAQPSTTWDAAADPIVTPKRSPVPWILGGVGLVALVGVTIAVVRGTDEVDSGPGAATSTATSEAGPTPGPSAEAAPPKTGPGADAEEPAPEAVIQATAAPTAAPATETGAPETAAPPRPGPPPPRTATPPRPPPPPPPTGAPTGKPTSGPAASSKGGRPISADL